MLKKFALAILSIVMITSFSAADDKPAPTTQDLQMNEYAKLAEPSEGHELLKQMVGDFDAEVIMYMPGSPDQKTAGVSHNKLVLGGRYLETRYEGTADGKPFEGIGYFGYNNLKKIYFATWIDTLSTSMMYSEGPADATGELLNMTCQMDDPITGKKQQGRNVTTIIDGDKHTYEMYMAGPDGKEFKVMTINYTRSKPKK